MEPATGQIHANGVAHGDFVRASEKLTLRRPGEAIAPAEDAQGRKGIELRRNFGESASGAVDARSLRGLEARGEASEPGPRFTQAAIDPTFGEPR
jgi:hypothetical protein